MKVGIVTEYYYPYLGGIAEHVHHTYAALKGRGHSVKIITPVMQGLRYAADASPSERAGTWAAEEDILRVGESHPFYFNGGFVRFTSPLGLKRRLRALFAAERFDLLHVHSPLVPTLPTTAVTTAPCPVVGTFHTVFTGGLSYRLFGPYFRRVLSRLDGCLAVSPFSAAATRRYFAADFTVIPNGVDVTRYHPANAPLPEYAGDDRLNILFVGRFDPHNGLPTLLASFPEVRHAYPQARLIIVGDGPLRGLYERSLPRAQRESVHFVGMQYARKPGFFASAHVFCQPAHFHAQSIVSLEAMASGLPIVASDIPASRWMMGDDALYFPPNDDRALAAGIVRLLAEPSLRASLGERVRARALRFSWERIADDMLAYYADVLTEREKPHA